MARNRFQSEYHIPHIFTTDIRSIRALRWQSGAQGSNRPKTTAGGAAGVICSAGMQWSKDQPPDEGQIMAKIYKYVHILVHKDIYIYIYMNIIVYIFIVCIYVYSL